MLLLQPARAAERPEPLGPYLLAVARDAPAADGAFPPVAVSHGAGGSPLSHRLLAAPLARHGLVVALPTHPVADAVAVVGHSMGGYTALALAGGRPSAFAHEAPLERRTVPSAGHFSFIAPFPAATAGPAFAPSQDPPGFDRAAFHEALNAEGPAFLRRVPGGYR